MPAGAGRLVGRIGEGRLASKNVGRLGLGWRSGLFSTCNHDGYQAKDRADQSLLSEEANHETSLVFFERAAEALA
jgi:hypothetical protein